MGRSDSARAGRALRAAEVDRVATPGLGREEGKGNARGRCAEDSSVPAGKPRRRGGQGEQPRRNRAGDPRHLPLAATRPAGIPARPQLHYGGRSAGLSCLSKPVRLPEPAIPRRFWPPGQRRAGIRLAWIVGPAEFQASSAGGKQGPRSQDKRGCGPGATPAPLPTWRPRPRGVSVYADGGGP